MIRFQDVGLAWRATNGGYWSQPYRIERNIDRTWQDRGWAAYKGFARLGVWPTFAEAARVCEMDAVLSKIS